MVTEEKDLKDFTVFVESLMKEAGMTKAGLARGLSVSRSYVSHLLSGNRRFTRPLLRGLAEVFSLPYADLVKGTVYEMMYLNEEDLDTEDLRELCAQVHEVGNTIEQLKERRERLQKQIRQRLQDAAS